MLEGPIWAVLTVVGLFIAGPLLLAAFIAVLVVPFVLLSLWSKVRDPEGLPGPSTPSKV